MSQGESGTATGEGGAAEQTSEEYGGGSALARYARRAFDSGALAGVAGGASVLAGARALRRGERVRGVVRLLVGGVLVAAAVRQRRRGGEESGIGQTDVVDTSPDIEDAGPAPDLDSDVDATGVDQTDVVESSADLADAASDAGAGETDTGEPSAVDADAVEAESHERFGAAAFDEYSAEVPVPQRAFNQEFITLGGEVFWGVRETDDAVVISGRYDPIDEAEGVEYVASSQVDQERTLSVPNEVRTHWDDVAGGGTTVVSGTDIVFVTADRLATNGQLLVVPEWMVEDVLGEEE